MLDNRETFHALLEKVPSDYLPAVLTDLTMLAILIGHVSKCKGESLEFRKTPLSHSDSGLMPSLNEFLESCSRANVQHPEGITEDMVVNTIRRTYRRSICDMRVRGYIDGNMFITEAGLDYIDNSARPSLDETVELCVTRVVPGVNLGTEKTTASTISDWFHGS